MSKHLVRELVDQRAIVHAKPPVSAIVDRSFEVPRALYAVTAALYFGFLAVMAVGFSAPGLIVPLAVCVVFLMAFFAVPVAFARVDPQARPLGFGRFRREGLATLTGRLNAGEAAAQMLILPVLILLWGFAVVTIAALV